MTFVATANVIEHVGARPVFVDVEPDTLNLDPALVLRAITPRTKAIIAVHYAGHPAGLAPLRALAAQYDLALIEDAAHALPATYHGTPIGAGRNPVAFSFYATKNITTAEGGMLTGTTDFVNEPRVLALHGLNRNAWDRYGKDDALEPPTTRGHVGHAWHLYVLRFRSAMLGIGRDQFIERLRE